MAWTAFSADRCRRRSRSAARERGSSVGSSVSDQLGLRDLDREEEEEMELWKEPSSETREALDDLCISV